MDEKLRLEQTLMDKEIILALEKIPGRLREQEKYECNEF